MALGGEMNDGARLVALQQALDKFAIHNVALFEAIARMGLDRAQVIQIARVGEFVEIDDVCGFFGDPLQNEVRANEAGAAGYENEIFHAG